MTMAFPMFFYVLYIVFLGLLTFNIRRKMVVEKKVSLKYMKDYKGEAPEEMVVMARHFDNQFQVPMLFLITCVSSHIFLGYSVSSFILAWVFILSRMVHSYVHLTTNNVIQRAQAFFFGVLVVLVMWVQILFEQWV